MDTKVKDAKATDQAGATGRGRPAGVKVLGNETVPLDKPSMRLVMQGWQAKLEAEVAKARLEEINHKLIEAHGYGCKLRVTGIASATLSARSAVRVSDEARLREVLGERWDDLVIETVSCRPRDALVELSVDGDDPLAPAVRECLVVANSESVTWRSDA